MAVAKNLRIEALEERLNFSVAGGILADAVAGAAPLRDTLLRRTRPRSIEWSSANGSTVGGVVITNLSTPQSAAPAPAAPSAPSKPRVYRLGALGFSTLPRTSAAQTYSDGVQKDLQLATPMIPATPISDPRYIQQGPVAAITWNDAPASSVNLSTMQWVSFSDNTADPRAVAARSLTLPAGRSGLILSDMANGLAGNPLDAFQTADGQLTGLVSPFMANGVQVVKARAEAFFSALAANSGRIDYVILDWEVSFSRWSMSDQQKAAVLTDPRAKALLATVGVDPAVNMDWSKWEIAVSNLCNQELNQAVFDVVRKYFPNATTSNFNSAATSSAYAVPDGMGHYYAWQSHAGTTNSPELYGYMGTGLESTQLTPGTPFGSSAYSTLLWEINTLRASMLSSPDGVVPWIAYQHFTSNLQDSPYYQELIYQAALSGAKDFLLWNPMVHLPTDNPADLSNDAQAQVVDQTLSDINAHLGTGTRTIVTASELAWNSGVVASGVQEGNQIIWRVSAPEGATAIKVVQTGQILSLNGGVGLWYTSTAGEPIDFLAI